MNKETTEKPTIETTEEKRSIGAEESQDPQCGEEHSESEQSTCAEQECIEEAAEDESNQEQKICELTKTLQLLQADFENYRKRAEKDNAEFKRYATKQLVIDLLPVLDNFELALKSINDPGVKMIYAQLFDIMEKHGLKQINPEGKFDPKQHEALLQEESEKEQNTILEVLQKGYIVGDTIVRPARVKIARKNHGSAGVSTRGAENV
ncbi:MAG: nucleotide exchange factor GrpE [Nanoarchaeota archaeon]|mgnify:CR=1 FL=1